MANIILAAQKVRLSLQEVRIQINMVSHSIDLVLAMLPGLPIQFCLSLCLATIPELIKISQMIPNLQWVVFSLWAGSQSY